MTLQAGQPGKQEGQNVKTAVRPVRIDTGELRAHLIQEGLSENLSPEDARAEAEEVINHLKGKSNKEQD